MSDTARSGVVVELPLGPADPWHALAARLRELTGEARVLVVRLAEDAGDRSGGRSTVARPNVVATLARADLVSVAVARGPVAGARLAIALHCDLRILGDAASIAVDAGAFGCLARLAAIAGYPRALELSLTGRRMSAREAASIGLANLVAPAAQLDEAVADLVGAVLATPRDVAIEMKAALTRVPSPSSEPAKARQIEAELAASDRLARDNETRGE